MLPLILVLCFDAKPAQAPMPPQAPAVVIASTCRCGDGCPLGGSCGLACACAAPKAAVQSPRPEGEGWQWDAKGYWWRPVASAPVTTYRPAMTLPVAPAPSYAIRGGVMRGGSSGAACAGGG